MTDVTTSDGQAWNVGPDARARLAVFLRYGAELLDVARVIGGPLDPDAARLWSSNARKLAFDLAGEVSTRDEVDVTLPPTPVDQLRDQLRADDAKRAALGPARRDLDNGHDPDCDCTACASADAHDGGRSCGSEWCGRCTS